MPTTNEMIDRAEREAERAIREGRQAKTSGTPDVRPLDPVADALAAGRETAESARRSMENDRS